MSIQSDIISALSGVAGDRIYPEAAPESIDLPMVIYVRKLREPLMTLGGPSGDVQSEFIFECYAKSKMEALTVADDVRTAILAAMDASPALLPIQYETQVSTEDYLPEVMEYMEPVGFSFWHS
ncbi:MAG: hypothetical protein ACREO5_14770 [Candidatus Binatia bacterium]